MVMLRPRVCRYEGCQVVFPPKGHGQKYCTARCRQLATGDLSVAHQALALKDELIRLRRELVEARSLLSDATLATYDGFLVETDRLRGLLQQLRDCADTHCGLCAGCIGAVQQIDLPKPVPLVTADDPIRQYRKPVAA